MFFIFFPLVAKLIGNLLSQPSPPGLAAGKARLHHRNTLMTADAAPARRPASRRRVSFARKVAVRRFTSERYYSTFPRTNERSRKHNTTVVIATNTLSP